MNEYGDFRIVEPIHSDGLVTTYHASKLGADGSELFVLRVYRPPDAIMGSPRAAMDMVRFLEAGISHREAAKDARHIVSVHAHGKAHGGAYIVTDGYRYTLQSLIDYRIRLSADDLRSLVEKIIRGLIEYQSKALQPHDNLIASTVMLNGMQDLTSSHVALAEPGMPTADVAENPSVDAAALGRLIHALVEFRPAWAPIRWPVPPSDAWRKLGRSGEHWRELTNRLLDPNAAENGDDLDLEDILRNLPIEPRDYRKPIGLSAAAIVIAALGGFLFWQFFYDPLISENEVRPLRDNITYVSKEHQAWLTDFKDSVRDDDPLADFLEEADLKDDVAYLDENVLGKIRKAEGKTYFDSRNYFPDNPTNWGNLDQYVNGESVDLTLFTRSQFEEIEDISELIQKLRKDFLEWKTKAFSTSVQKFAERNWNKASESLQHEIGDDGDPPRIEQLKNLLEARRHLLAIDSLWDHIDNVYQDVPVNGQDVLRRFQPIMQDLMAPLNSVEAIHTVLATEKNKDLVARMLGIARDEDPKIEWVLFEKDVGPPAEDTFEAFDAWSREADQYRRLPPETRIDKQQYLTDLKTLRDNIGYLMDFEATEEAERFRRNQQAVETAFQLTRELDRIIKNESQLDGAVNEVLKLATYAEDCEEQYRIVAIPANEYLDEQRLLSYQSTSLVSSWNNAIDSVGSAATLDSDRKKYGAARKRLKGTQAIFQHLDETALSIQPEDLPVRSSGWDPDVALGILSQKRELAIGRVARKVESSDSPPTLETTEIVQTLESEENIFGDWYGQAQRMFTCYLKIERMFDEGHHPDEPDQASGETVLSLVSEWETDQSESSALLREFRPALTGIIDRIDLSRNVMKLDNPQEVMSIVEGRDPSVQPELYRTAWNRLGELADANHVTAIHQDHQLLVAITGWLESFDGNPERQQFVKDSLESEAHDRWVSRMQKRPLPADDKDEELEQYEAALQLYEPFHVRTGDLATWLQWNLNISRFRSEMKEMDKEVQHEVAARKAVTDLQSGFDAFGPEITGLDSIKTMTEELILIANEEKTTVDFNVIGPAGTDLRWTYDMDQEVRNEERPNYPPKEIVYYYIPPRQKKIELRFKLLDRDKHSDLSDHVYVSTEEVSFKMFKRVAEHPKHMKYLENMIELGIGNDDGRDGPHVWEQAQAVPQGMIALKAPSQWLVEDPSRPTPDQGPRLLPSLDHPVQHVSAIVAMYVANVFGCRLPTTDEFKAAIVEQYGDLDFTELLNKINSNNFAGHIPNLRDSNFTKYLDFAVTEMAEERKLKYFSPENGAFLPDPDRDHSYPFNDNNLWFDHTRAAIGNGFQHLYGNVQEWVYDDPDSVTPAEDEPLLSPQEILRNLKVKYLGVIGGSALSSTLLSPSERQDAEDLVIPEDLLKMTYADVGFRLVIAGKFDTVAQQVLAATSRGYVNLN